MQTQYKQLTGLQWQPMKTSLPIQRKRKKTRSIPQGFSDANPKVHGTPWEIPSQRDALGMGRASLWGGVLWAFGTRRSRWHILDASNG